MLRLEIVDGIARVALNRPDKRNALSFAMLRELLACAKTIERDRRVRAVILHGVGESFCAGIDLQDLANPKHRWSSLWELLRPGPSLFQRAFLIWQQLPVPVIAVLHGHCYGAGMQLALAADIRVAAPGTQLSIMEARWGLVPDMGLTRTLRGLVAPDVARELTYTARVVDSGQAKTLGLVTHVADDAMALAASIAAEIAQRSPDAVLAAKRVLDDAWHSPGRALRSEKRWQLKLVRGRNFSIARRRAQAPDLPFEPREYS